VSWELMLAARAAPVDSTARHVLMVIASHANRQGHAWPSTSTLALETGLHRRTVELAVQRIESAGVLDVIHRRGRSCEYLFPQDPHPARKTANPARSTAHPARSTAHKDYEERSKNAPDDARRTTWRAAGGDEDSGPVDMRAALAGIKQQLAGARNGDRDR
jgi:DNA-binding transcriptional MocR family regulator